MREHTFTLPSIVVSRLDIGRLERELEALESALQSERIRKKPEAKELPTISTQLAAVVEQNNLSLNKVDDRAKLHKLLAAIRTQAPQLHFSFSVDPSPRFLASLLSWLRKEIHPVVLLRIGLEPALGAGCTLRTPTRFFDLSLKQHFAKQHEQLNDKIRGN